MNERRPRSGGSALNSPLLNTKEIENAQRLLYIIYTCKEKPVSITELGEINSFMDTLPEDLEVLWGLYHDDTIGDQVKVAVVATGFDKEREHRRTVEEDNEYMKKLWAMYYPEYSPFKLEEPVTQEVEDSRPEEAEEDMASEENYDDSDVKPKHRSWFNSFVNFVKGTLEEE